MNLDPIYPKLSPLTLPDVPSNMYPHHLHVLSLCDSLDKDGLRRLIYLNT